MYTTSHHNFPKFFSCVHLSLHNMVCLVLLVYHKVYYSWFCVSLLLDLFLSSLIVIVHKKSKGLTLFLLLWVGFLIYFLILRQYFFSFFAFYTLIIIHWPTTRYLVNDKNLCRSPTLSLGFQRTPR